MVDGNFREGLPESRFQILSRFQQYHAFILFTGLWKRAREAIGIGKRVEVGARADSFFYPNKRNAVVCAGRLTSQLYLWPV